MNLMDYPIIFEGMSTSEHRKMEGFEGQKAIVIPRGILTGFCEKNVLISPLYLTDIGYYPKARFHYRRRPDGAAQHILVYCAGGAGTVSINGVGFPVTTGTFFVIPRKNPHFYFADPDNPWTIYWIHFTGTQSDPMVNLLREKLGGFTGTLLHFRKSIDLFDEIYAQLARGYGTDNLVYAGLSLSYLLNTFIYRGEYPDEGTGNSASSIDVAIAFFRENIHRRLSLKEMASAAGLSVSHFSMVFRRSTGFPPLEYFNHLKMQQACQFLLFTRMKVKDIAGELGMPDPYYFSRCFTRTMGISPRQYRHSGTVQP